MLVPAILAHSVARPPIQAAVDFNLAEDVAARLSRADPVAIAWVYERYGPAVRAFAARLLGDPEIAEDLVHDVFVELPSSVGRFRGDCSVRSFLISIAVNLSRHHVRTAMRRRDALGRLALLPATPRSTPEHDAQTSELAEAHRRALNDRTDEHRTTFLLCEVEEMSAAEASAILQIPEATVRTRLFHAKRKLRDRLGAEGYR